MKTKLRNQPIVNVLERMRLCLHEKKVDRYEFRCQPSLAEILHEKGPEWVRNTLINELVKK